MKAFIILVILGVVAYFLFFNTPNTNDTDKKEKKPRRDVGNWGGVASDVNEFTDYGTGKTQVTTLQRTKSRLKQLSIDQAVSSFVGAKGRRPTSLADLVQAGYLKQDQTRDKYGSDLISGIEGGKFYVRSIGCDKRPNTRDDWIKRF